MEYSKLISATGLPGLFELINSRGDGAIVKSLEDGKTQFISGRKHNVSQLESIEVFTIRDNVNLVDVFNAMEKDSTALPDAKDNAAVRKYMEKVYPDMDFERVYASDMKKMIKWFDVLKKNNVEIKLTEIKEEPEVIEEPAEKPKKAAAKKENEEEKPAVKKAAKPAVKAEKTVKKKDAEPAAKKSTSKPAVQKTAKTSKGK